MMGTRVKSDQSWLLGGVPLPTARLLLCIPFFFAWLSREEDAYASDDRAVRRGTHPVWVDRETESVRVPPHQLEQQDYSDRHDAIKSESGSSNRFGWWDYLFGSGSGSSFWSSFFDGLMQVWRILLILILLCVVGSAIYYIVRTGKFSYFARRAQQTTLGEDVELQQAKISELPFELEGSMVGLRAQAEKYRNSGDYSKAIVYLFSYLLVELDQSHCIRLERGKTNGVYLREVTPWTQLCSYLQGAVRLFEQAYFGRRQIDRDAFEELWSKIIAFEQMLAQIRSSSRLTEISSSRSGALLNGETQ